MYYYYTLLIDLLRAVMADSSSGRDTRDAPAISEADKHFIYLLVTEKLPQLIAYMPKIKSSKQGGIC